MSARLREDSDIGSRSKTDIWYSRTRRARSSNDFNYWYDITRKVSTMAHRKSMNAICDDAEFIAGRVKSWIEGFGGRIDEAQDFKDFRRTWRVVRAYIPLQVRLVAEQVLYDMGPPWSSLCTGFSPISD